MHGRRSSDWNTTRRWRSRDRGADRQGLRYLIARQVTRTTIRPPFSFHVVDALITNFHLPRSSLLLLTAAFAGLETVRSAYQLAVEREYRFYSYGDHGINSVHVR